MIFFIRNLLQPLLLRAVDPFQIDIPAHIQFIFSSAVHQLYPAVRIFPQEIKFFFQFLFRQPDDQRKHLGGIHIHYIIGIGCPQVHGTLIIKNRGEQRFFLHILKFLILFSH